MIFLWRPETEMVHSVSHQPDLTAHEALRALCSLSRLMLLFGDGSLQAVIHVFSFIVRLGHIRIRRHEETLLRSIHDRMLLKHEPADYDSPYFKIFLLLRAHLLRLPLSPELTADLAIVLEHVFSVFSVCAHHDWSGSDASVFEVWRHHVFPLMRMCVHGMSSHDLELKEIPHFKDDVSCSIKLQGLWLTYVQVLARFTAAGIWFVRKVVNMDTHRRNDLLRTDTQKMCVSMRHDCRLHLTLSQTGCRGFPKLLPGTLRHHSVPREGSIEGRRAHHTRGHSSPDHAGCGGVPSRRPTPTSDEEACILDGRHHDRGFPSTRNDVRDRGEDARGQT
jgi:hypothetical protein